MTGRAAPLLPVLSSTTLSLKKITLMTMHWDTYLVRLNPDVNCMDAWQERLYRKDAITEGFIRSQAQEMALALEDSRNVLHSLNLNPINQRGASTNPDQTNKEIHRTVSVMNTVLQDWELNKDYPLRFYPYKPDRFDRYSI